MRSPSTVNRPTLAAADRAERQATPTKSAGPSEATSPKSPAPAPDAAGSTSGQLVRLGERTSNAYSGPDQRTHARPAGSFRPFVAVSTLLKSMTFRTYSWGWKSSWSVRRVEPSSRRGSSGWPRRGGRGCVRVCTTCPPYSLNPRNRILHLGGSIRCVIATSDWSRQ